MDLDLRDLDGLPLGQLRDVVEHHDGVKAMRRWEPVELSVRVFDLAASRVRQLADRLDADSELSAAVVADVGPPDPRRTQTEVEVVYRVTALVAVAKSMVDQHRTFVRKHYGGTHFAERYQEQAAELGRDPVVRTLSTAMRNYALHDAILPLVIERVPVDGGARCDVLLDRDRLLENERITGTARDFLQGQPPYVSLTQLVDDYTDRIRPLYGLMHEQFTELHGELAADAGPWVELLHRRRGSVPATGPPPPSPGGS